MERKKERPDRINGRKEERNDQREKIEEMKTPESLLESSSHTPEESPPNSLDSKSSTKSNPKKDMEAMIEFYLADNPHLHNNRRTGELEIRFGTNPKSGKPLSKIDYDNVVQVFYSAGFNTENTEI